VKRIAGALRELIGLFVDDGSLAVALLAWTAAAGLGLPHLGLSKAWDAAILLAGYLAILFENLARSARRGPSRPAARP
jgi:hypothetical protein